MLEIIVIPYEKSEISYTLARNEKWEILYPKCRSDLPLVHNNVLSGAPPTAHVAGAKDARRRQWCTASHATNCFVPPAGVRTQHTFPHTPVSSMWRSTANWCRSVKPTMRSRSIFAAARKWFAPTVATEVKPAVWSTLFLSNYPNYK